MSISYATFKQYLSDFLTLPGHCMILSFLVLSCAMGSQSSNAETPISVQQLETLCRLPAPCGAAKCLPFLILELGGSLNSAKGIS